VSQTLLRKIQEAAIDHSTDLPSLLRMCKVLAMQLRSTTLKAWVDAELNGYKNRESLPDYRIIGVPSELTVFNPVSGNKTVDIPRSAIEAAVAAEGVEGAEAEEMADTLCKAYILQNVAEIAALIAAHQTVTAMHWTPEVVALVAPRVSPLPPVRARMLVGTQRLVGILDVVRTRVLDMVLELVNEDPTLGEGDAADMSKEKGKRVEQIVQNTFNITGDNNTINAPVTQGQNNVKVGDLDSLKTALHQLGMAPEDVEQTALVVQEEKTAKNVFERLTGLKERLGLKAAAAVEVVEKFFGI
jgi:hypothetical protein